MRKLYIILGALMLSTSVLLAQKSIDSTASLKELAALAKKGNYVLDASGATVAYLALLQKMQSNGEKKEVIKASKALMKDAQKANAPQTRQAALVLLMNSYSKEVVTIKDFNLRSPVSTGAVMKEAYPTDDRNSLLESFNYPIEITKLVQEALKDPSSQYRFAALRAASEHNYNGLLYRDVIKVFPKAKDDVKIDIAGWMQEEAECIAKREKMQSLVEPLIAGLQTTNPELQTAIAKALVQLGNKNAINPLVALVASGHEPAVTIGKNALATFDGNITDPLAHSLNGANDAGSIAILELLALKKSSSHLGQVISLTNTGSDVVKTVAYNTLKSLVKAQNIESMYSMLEADNGENIIPLEEAIIAALNDMPEENRFEEISSRVAKTPENKKYLYSTILATIAAQKNMIQNHIN